MTEEKMDYTLLYVKIKKTLSITALNNTFAY